MRSIVFVFCFASAANANAAGVFYDEGNPNLAGLSASLLPSADDTYNIGSASFRWAEGYFSDALSLGTTGNGVRMYNSGSQLLVRNFADSAYVPVFTLQIVATAATRAITTQNNGQIVVGPTASYCFGDNAAGNSGNITACLYSGTGTPEGSRTAAIGSIYLRLDGGAVTSFYVKESGTGNTGWVAK
jgi:hypothetical protein